MDSPDQVANNQPVFEGALSEVDAPLEKRILAGVPSNVDEMGEGSPSRVGTALLPSPRPADTVSSRMSPLDQVLLSTYIPPYERIHPPAGMVALDLEGSQEIIHG